MLPVSNFRAAGNFNFSLQEATIANNICATTQKIESFAALPTGWHYGEGITPHSSRIANARDWLEKLVRMGFSTTDAFPGVDGEILIAAYHQNDNVELVLESDNTLSLYYERNDEAVISLSHKLVGEIETALGNIAREIWSTLGSFITETSTRGKIDSTDWHLRTMGVVAQSFSVFAFSKLEPQSVLTSRNIMRQLQGSQQYFGGFQITNFLPVARSYRNHQTPGMNAILTFTGSQTTNTPNF